VFRLFDMELDTTRTIQVIILTFITMAYGGISYIFGAKVFRIPEYDIVMSKAKKLIIRFGFKNEKNK